MKSQASNRLIVFDTTLRDGEQSPGVSLSAAQKVEIAAALDDLGVDVIEAGFPAASRGDAEAVASVASHVSNASVCALARCCEGDIRTAAQSIEDAARPRLHVFIATSPIHRRSKLRLSAAQVMRKAKDAIRLASALCGHVEFSAEDATRTEPEFLSDMVSMAAEAGARTVNIPDTVGYSTPVELSEMIEAVCLDVRRYPGVTVSVHCHDDLGLAVANSLAGVKAGARQVECTINGLGERAGNAALEEIVMALRTRQRLWDVETHVRSEKLVGVSELVSRHTGFPVPANKAIVGANAFRHESGIHQHGVIGDSRTYEIISARDVGAETELVLGKHSGRHAFRNYLQERGVKLDSEQLDRAFQRFKYVADKSEELAESEILAVAREVCSSAAKWHLEDISHDGAGSTQRVSVVVKDRIGRVSQGVGWGVLKQAVSRALSDATGFEIRVIASDSDVQAQGDGTQARARVDWEVNGRRFCGSSLAATEHEAMALAILENLAAPSAQRVEAKDG